MALELHKNQKLIAKDSHRFRVVNCGRKFGKTTLAGEEIGANAISGNDRQIVYMGTTLKESRDIIWNNLKKRTAPIQADKPNETRLELEVKTQDGGTSIIYIRGWESVESLRGMEFDFMVLDEVAKFKDFAMYWQEVLRPTLTPRQGSSLFISTPRGFNHFYDLYNIEQTDKDYKSFHFTTYDNPFIPVEEIEEAKRQMTEDRFAQEYMAEFKKMEGLVYKEFDRNRHLFDINDLPITLRETIPIAGVDFGFTNPAAIVFIKIDNIGRYWIIDEWYKTGKTDEEIAEYLSQYGIKYAYPDPASPEAIEVLKRKGVNLRDVVKGKDSVVVGINKVRELLKQGRIKVANHCLNIINEFETYRYDEDNNKETPLKENDHALDALRYVVMMTSKPKRPIPISLKPPKTREYKYE